MNPPGAVRSNMHPRLIKITILTVSWPLTPVNRKRANSSTHEQGGTVIRKKGPRPPFFGAEKSRLQRVAARSLSVMVLGSRASFVVELGMHQGCSRLKKESHPDREAYQLAIIRETSLFVVLQSVKEAHRLSLPVKRVVEECPLSTPPVQRNGHARELIATAPAKRVSKAEI